MKKGKKILAILAAVVIFTTFTFVGCNNTNNNTGTVTDAGTTTGDVMNDLENGASNVGDAVGDAARGVGDAARGIVDGGFGTYNDAHGYIMSRFSETDTNGRYEVRNENKDLVSYDTGKEGYRFELYNTANGEKRVGEFYVDAADGTIHKMNETSKAIEPYIF